MNKQELIDKYTAEISRLRPYCPNRHLISEQLKYDLYKEILEDLKQLDEPQKVKVPKFVAEWIEQAKKERQSLYEAMYNIESSTYYHKYDNATYQWMFEGALHDEHQELFAEAYMHGYEVEKGPLWAIKNADGNYLTKCALWGKDGVNYSFECNPSHRLLFTDKATADAAALLVNGTVEEVAEG
ncbi:phage protein, putative [Enterococcus hirae]|nr:phage protein, putative [Enterococcus hirae]